MNIALGDFGSNLKSVYYKMNFDLILAIFAL